MIVRNYYLKQLKEAFANNPICSILGPRQCGKTTLAQLYAKKLSEVHTFDLENPADIAALESPSLTLPPLEGLIIIDEVQRRPDLFPYLRYLVDHFDEKISVSYLKKHFP
ncbi:MAG: AAA family ATPase [Chthoniobacterales bacterium]